MEVIYSKYFFLLFIFLMLCQACSKTNSPVFQEVPSRKTGITFENIITTTDSLNSLTDPFIYNGAGVATGDINNDGLVDIFFTGNMTSSRLYLNKGNMEFEDITQSAGVETDRWATGASMVDINADGFLDIYVSVSGPKWTQPENRENLLFVNNGDPSGDGQAPIFTEVAAQYGINDNGFTTHAAFLDYDRDGDPDLFLLGNSPEEFSRGETGSMPMGGLIRANPSGFDQLYRNNGNDTFTNVSVEAGILRKLGYGLGVAVSDLNRDGWPDIYVSNDITPNDVLYINNRDGTFTDKAAEWLRHTSYAGMGIDIADFTNNGWPDILQTDMMPPELNEQKRMSGSTTYGGFVDLRRRGFYPDYNINTLQLNQGTDRNGDVIFSEVARLAGVEATNWSWTALFADMDNDGWKDIFITNGYPKALNDFDYLSDMHGTENANSREGFERQRAEILDELHGYDISNYIYRNDGDPSGEGQALSFTDMTVRWGMNEPGYSYGAAYADLNNDGRLDLVINNINSEASIYQNVAPEEHPGHHITVKLSGEVPNTGGIGAEVTLWAGGQKQLKYQNPYRGYMSTVDPRLHFGLGEVERADSLRITWPDGRTQKLTDVEANQSLTLNQADAIKNTPADFRLPHFAKRTFEQINPTPLAYRHRMTRQADFSIQPLLPYQISRQGPPLAVGDVNGDGLEDVYIGGAAGLAGKLFLQQKDGRFEESSHNQPWQADSEQEDWDALFFDANMDGLLDLYVASGGYHSSPVSLLLQDRLYINHGNGRFLKDTQALPQMLTSTGTIAAADINGDGYHDLFVGGRLTPRDWPRPARSWLLRNDGGRFTDVTDQLAPELADSGGMITDAVWMDFNTDGQTDLVTAGEWMPLQFFANDGQRFRNVTETMGLPPLRGWWFSLESGDFNGDGRPDLAAGNLGMNHTYTTAENEKFGVIAGDFTGNRTTDIILTKQINGIEYPLYGLAKLGREIYTLGIRYQSFKQFAGAPLREVIGSEAMDGALQYHADTFASIWLENRPDGTFAVNPLPRLAQISPIQNMIASDVDADGHLDLIIAGNLYHTEPTAPRADAGNGLWLKGDAHGGFTPVPPQQSGLLAPKNVRDLALIETGRLMLLVANNDDSLQVFHIVNH